MIRLVKVIKAGIMFQTTSPVIGIDFGINSRIGVMEGNQPKIL